MNPESSTPSRGKLPDLGGVLRALLRRFQQVFQTALAKLTVPEEILLWPPFRDRGTLTEILNRLCFYLGPDERVQVLVEVRGLRPGGGLPPYMPAYTQLFRSRIAVVKGPPDLPFPRLIRHQRILLWRRPGRFQSRLAARILPHVRVIDPEHCQFEYASVTSGLKPRARVAESSRERFLAWRSARPRKDKVYLLATGPSLSRFREFDFSDGYVIACNSVAASREILEHASVDLLAAADPVFHFGPSSYAHEFRRLLAGTARRYGYRLVTLDAFGEIVDRHLRLPPSSVFELPLRDDQRIRRLDESWAVPRTANVLTLLMIPLAFTLASELFILGADGRKPTDVGFWRRAPAPELDRVEASVRACHPAFFSRRDYRAYYRRHCATLERQIRAIEQAGGSVRTLAPSSIPALAGRLFSK